MGADFTLLTLACKGSSEARNDMKARLATAKRAVKRLTMEEAKEIDTLTFMPRNDHDDIDVAVTARQLLSSIAAVRAAVLHGSRDVTVVHGGAGIILYITGGFSWGDSPSELYDDFRNLAVFSGFRDARDEKISPSPRQGTHHASARSCIETSVTNLLGL